MPRQIDRDKIRELMEQGAQLVEVLAREEYEEDHLPGAINLPLRSVDVDARRILDPSRPVITYCWDSA